MSKDKTKWLSQDVFPLYIAFCPSKKAWEKTIKKLSKSLIENPYPSGLSNSFVVENDSFENGAPLGVIVTIKKECLPSLAEFAAYEAAQILHLLKEHIGEKASSPKMETCLIKSITGKITRAATQSWGEL